MEQLREGDPRQVGPYRLTERLGGGGMGQVFLGRSRGGRTVAVKVVRPELAEDAGFRHRFAVEVEAARRVGGFYTAQVVDADPGADPPWLVTAYVPGPSLYQAVSEHGPLPPAAIGVLGAGLAEGLTAIHACDLVHRDLKPGNVILAADGPRVIDFGIARALDATSHTVSGAVVGTPAFMSPEQVRGGEVGPASDVFALGAVLVFAATGRGPFNSGQTHAIMYRIVHDDPDLTGLSPGLADLVGACLAKTPQERPSLTDLLDRLTAVAENGTRWLPPEVTAMITLLEQDLSSPSGGPTEPPPSPASGDANDPVASQRVDALLNMAQMEKEAGNVEEARRLFQQASEIGNPWQKGWALICWGALEHGDAGNVEEARRLYERATETGQPCMVSIARSNLGAMARDAGNLEEARRLFQQAAEIGCLQDRVTALNHWANMERSAGNLERARQLYKQVVDVKQSPTKPGA